MDPYAPALQHKCKRGFFSTVAWGISMTAITGIICATGVGMYGLRIVDRKSDSIFDFAQQTLGKLPEIQKSLPPFLADAVNDERRPDYMGKLKVTAKLTEGLDKHGGVRSMIEITNTGEEVVSMLPVRITITDAKGGGISERTRMAATPLGVADEDWPGPLMPGATRKLVQRVYLDRGSNFENADDYKIECEVTDVRIWKPATPATKVVASTASMPD